MDWIADTIAGLALLFAAFTWWQSTRSAGAADVKLERAEQIAKEARDALQASAAALAEANEIERAKLPRSPWTKLQQGTQIQFRNDSASELLHVTLEQENGDDLTPLQEMPVELVHPNGEVAFAYGRTLASEAIANITLKWQTAEHDQVHEHHATIS